MTINVYLLYESRRKYIQRNKERLPPALRKSVKLERFLESDDGIADVIIELKKTPISVTAFELDGDDKWVDVIKRDSRAIVWNVTDGYEYFIGSNIPATCSVLKKPFVGSNSYIQVLCQNKHHLKSVVAPYGVATPYWACVGTTSKVTEWKKFPCFVKPSSFDNSIGDSLNSPICHTLDDINRNIESFSEVQIKNVLIEEFLPGTEYTVCCIQGRKQWLFECLEVEYGAGEQFFSSKTKEIKGTYKLVSKSPEHNELIRLSRLIIDVIGIEDYCRIDFRKGSDGDIQFLEVNTAPFLSSNAFDYLAHTYFKGRRDEMYREIVEGAYTRKTGASRLALL